ncbi:hypothetical protein G4177_00685 [Corallococcus sp. ZKHCc1 1396]|uniref:Uncharacterized protein n=1 Tax=Corallococcus soli TaxID=2710757 RepID=A0ABR9PFJ7_9BACT|nr:hypothetical protein [Corallococcus soli]MBE4746686.1 hypothetical protein [Corallococcus soli]
MSSLWFNVPFLYCRFRMVIAHSTRRQGKPDSAGMRSESRHAAQVVISGSFRLQGSHSVLGAYFHDTKAVYRVQGWIKDAVINTGPQFRQELLTTKVVSGLTTPGTVSLSIKPEFDHRATLSAFVLEEHRIRMQVHTVQRLASPNLNGSTEEDTVDVFDAQFNVCDGKVPETPGELRINEKTDGASAYVPDCQRDCEKPMVSCVLRLTPGIPAFRIVDDSVEQNPIQNCRIRVRGPDGREQELETDAHGEVFIPRTGDEVYTLLGVVQDEAPLAGALLGEWTVESMPDLP